MGTHDRWIILLPSLHFSNFLMEFWRKSGQLLPPAVLCPEKFFSLPIFPYCNLGLHCVILSLVNLSLTKSVCLYPILPSWIPDLETFCTAFLMHILALSYYTHKHTHRKKHTHEWLCGVQRKSSRNAANKEVFI